MLCKRLTQPSFLPRSASYIPNGLGVWVSSGLAERSARSPGLSLCRLTEARELLFPKGSTRYPWDLFYQPRPSTLSSLSTLFANEQSSRDYMELETQARLSWGDGGCEKGRRPWGGWREARATKVIHLLQQLQAKAQKYVASPPPLHPSAMSILY